MVKSASIGKVIFLEDFLAKERPNPAFRSVSYKNQMLYSNEAVKHPSAIKPVLIQDVPDYLNIAYSKQSTTLFKHKQLKTQQGYLIDLSLFKSANEYFAKKFGPKSRSNLRRYENRLKLCFEISYVSYYGHIAKEEYERLFVALRNMLIRRFEQKKEKNYELQYLADFEASVYDMVCKKSAMIYVTYHKDKPISIRINMFKHNLAYYIISGYDIDYSKFHLGNIDMMKNIEWLFDHDFTCYDLLKGYYYYKKKWMTHSYHNQLHFIYPSSSLTGGFIYELVYIKELSRKVLFDFLRFFNIPQSYKKLKRRIMSQTSSTSHQKWHTISDEPNTEDFAKKKIIIDIENDNNYFFLRNAVYDFLFECRESYAEVRVYASTEHLNTYQIKGKSNSRLLRLPK